MTGRRTFSDVSRSHLYSDKRLKDAVVIAHKTGLVPANLQSVLDEVVAGLRAGLSDNLDSCCLYGSTVRGNTTELSDINLLIILKQSTPVAHEAIAQVIGNKREVSPFILGRSGFERSVRAFAAKFASIRRHYRVLSGTDPFARVQIEPGLERFLCEQALRNLRLRLAHVFITRARTRAYGRYLVESITPLFVSLSDIVRLNGMSVPQSFDDRVEILARELALDGQTLRDLLRLRQESRKLGEREVLEWHFKVFPLVDQAIGWIEKNWPVEHFPA